MTNKDTRFQKGVSGNRKGRPLGSRNQSILAVEKLMENQAAAITQKCVDMAMDGDPTALKLCISRLIPIRRERSVSLALQPLEGSKDALSAIGTVLEAVGSGVITPGEGTSVARLLDGHRAAYKTEELENRLIALEARVCGAN
ncbi:MAG: DUF5681 domain-containing protein [Alphaproteobacteria bacterium]